MTDARKPAPPIQPPRPPQAPPLKVAPGAAGPRAPIAPFPNPTLPRPTPPNQGVALPKPGGLTHPANMQNSNGAKLGTSSVNSSVPSPSQMPLGAPGSNSMPPAASKPPTPAAPPKSAEISKSPFRFLPFILGGLLLLGIIGFIVLKLLGGTGLTNTAGTPNSPKETVTLTYWGLWEPSAVLTQVITDYESAHPGITINYQQQSYRDYHDRLQTAISQNKGPDIFRFHASWVPMLQQELSPMPSTVYTTTEFQNTFYPIATKQLTLNNSIVGVPLEYDGLELFYNQDIFNTANVQPPTTWAAMKQVAQQLTIRDSSGKIQRAGVAIGNASNVDHFSDILGLLLLQNGVDPKDVTSQPAVDALSFYTSFVSKDKVWDDTLPSSTTAFARGDVAMMLAPSWRVHDIQALNPNLKFAVAPVPQLTDNKVTWGSYWAEGVNAQSTHKAEAWEFLKYMSSASTMQKFYSDASKVRSFGEIYSRKDLAGTLASDQYVGAFVNDAPYAQDWYLNSATHDNGINDNTIKYFEDAINKSLSGSSILNTLTTAQLGQTQILNQYGVAVKTLVVPAQ